MKKNKQEKPTLLQTIILVVGVLAIVGLAAMHLYAQAKCYEAKLIRPEVVCK